MYKSKHAHYLEAYIEVGPTDYLAQIEYEVYPGSFGRAFGPPENCYPPEPAEINIESVKICISDNDSKLDISQMLECSKFYDYIETLIHEELESEAECNFG